MSIIACTVGLSNSGKTKWTWNTLARSPFDTFAISRDALRLALHGQRYDPEREAEINALEELCVKSALLYGYHIVIVDACHHTEALRIRWAKICEREDWELRFHVINTPADECIRRALAKGDNDIVPVIEKQAKEADFWDGL